MDIVVDLQVDHNPHYRPAELWGIVHNTPSTAGVRWGLCLSSGQATQGALVQDSATLITIMTTSRVNMLFDMRTTPQIEQPKATTRRHVRKADKPLSELRQAIADYDRKCAAIDKKRQRIELLIKEIEFDKNDAEKLLAKINFLRNSQ